MLKLNSKIWLVLGSAIILSTHLGGMVHAAPLKVNKGPLLEIYSTESSFQNSIQRMNEILNRNDGKDFKKKLKARLTSESYEKLMPFFEKLSSATAEELADIGHFKSEFIKRFDSANTLKKEKNTVVEVDEDSFKWFFTHFFQAKIDEHATPEAASGYTFVPEYIRSLLRVHALYAEYVKMDRQNKEGIKESVNEVYREMQPQVDGSAAYFTSDLASTSQRLPRHELLFKELIKGTPSSKLLDDISLHIHNRAVDINYLAGDVEDQIDQLSTFNPESFNAGFAHQAEKLARLLQILKNGMNSMDQAAACNSSSAGKGSAVLEEWLSEISKENELGLSPLSEAKSPSASSASASVSPSGQAAPGILSAHELVVQIHRNMMAITRLAENLIEIDQPGSGKRIELKERKLVFDQMKILMDHVKDTHETLQATQQRVYSNRAVKQELPKGFHDSVRRLDKMVVRCNTVNK